MKTSRAMTKDPVCGMMVGESSTLRVEHDGKTVYFCSETCKKEFLSAPAGAKTKGKSGCC